MKREEIKVTSIRPRLEVIIFSGSEGDNESKKLGGQEIFVEGGRLQTTISYLEVRHSGGEVGSSAGGGLSDRPRRILGGDAMLRSCMPSHTGGMVYSGY